MAPGSACTASQQPVAATVGDKMPSAAADPVAAAAATNWPEDRTACRARGADTASGAAPAAVLETHRPPAALRTATASGERCAICEVLVRTAGTILEEHLLPQILERAGDAGLDGVQRLLWRLRPHLVRNELAVAVHVASQLQQCGTVGHNVAAATTRDVTWPLGEVRGCKRTSLACVMG